MTNEEKDLLLKDLCARLPYGVVCYNSNTESNFKLCDVADIDSGYPTFDYGYGKLENVKPYLRPMESMTEEEKIEWDAEYAYNSHTYSYEEYLARMLDWLNKKKFDYRGLISIGLALEAPEGMYND